MQCIADSMVCPLQTDLADGSVYHRLGAVCAAEPEHQTMLLPVRHEGMAAELADDGQLGVGNMDSAAALLRT